MFGACALALAGASGAVGAEAVPVHMRGAALIESCRAGRADCGAYLQGVLDGLISSRAVCDAPRYDREQLRSVYLRWAETDTYLQDKHMLAGAERAFKQAWPCANGMAALSLEAGVAETGRPAVAADPA
jgi:hypothetical protein